MRTPNCPPFGSSDAENDPSFDVVIAYEDFETGRHARRTYDFLVETVGHDCRLTNQMWKFDVLKMPKLRQIAANDASLADVVIISTHGTYELPPEVKEWIELWLAQPGNTLALVALFDRPDEPREKAPAIRAYLARIAKRGRMGFFAPPDDWPGRKRKPDPFLFRFDSILGGRVLSTLSGAIQPEPGFSHWGVNE